MIRKTGKIADGYKEYGHSNYGIWGVFSLTLFKALW